MPRDAFEKVFQGQPFKPGARLWNLILDAVRFVMDEQNRRGRRDPPMTYKYFRITSISPLDSGVEGVDLNKWEYTGREVLPTSFDPENPGDDMYIDRAGGIIGAKLYNDAEERNSGVEGASGDEQLWTYRTLEGITVLSTGVFNNGVFAAEMPDLFEVRAIPKGRVVRAYYTLVAGGAEWRFSEPNGIGGECEGAAAS